ncbi:MAG: ribosomal L7Ae/L30e/S12e/Gadd45 family protein [Eubacteriales bacterium]|nr:ribosomal L7Ae/L30e/S12e/Gadd45 family protein [Eubacteriales bacterium]
MEHILSMIGLAKKADRVEIGEEPVGSAVRAKKARVILIAQDAAASSVRRAKAFANVGNCLYLIIPADKDDLGRCLGRTSCAMAAVTDIGFADAIVKKLAAIDPEKYGDAAEKMDVKARRAAERKREQAQHEKNVRQGKKRVHAEAPAPQTGEKKEKRPAHPYTKRRGMKTVDRDRFAGSRPVKKGKGSDHKKK